MAALHTVPRDLTGVSRHPVVLPLITVTVMPDSDYYGCTVLSIPTTQRCACVSIILLSPNSSHCENNINNIIIPLLHCADSTPIFARSDDVVRKQHPNRVYNCGRPGLSSNTTMLTMTLPNTRAQSTRSSNDYPPRGTTPASV